MSSFHHPNSSPLVIPTSTHNYPSCLSLSLLGTRTPSIHCFRHFNLNFYSKYVLQTAGFDGEPFRPTKTCGFHTDVLFQFSSLSEPKPDEALVYYTHPFTLECIWTHVSLDTASRITPITSSVSQRRVKTLHHASNSSGRTTLFVPVRIQMFSLGKRTTDILVSFLPAKMNG